MDTFNSRGHGAGSSVGSMGPGSQGAAGLGSSSLGPGFGGLGSLGGGGGPISTSGAGTLYDPSDEQAEAYASAFLATRDRHNFVSAEEGRKYLQRSGLPEQMLRNIWDLSDLDRDRRLSLREFACALNLADHVRGGRPLPAQVRVDQQSACAQRVERIVVAHEAVRNGVIPGELGPDGKPLRHEVYGSDGKVARRERDDFSTADTDTLGAMGGLWGHTYNKSEFSSYGGAGYGTAAEVEPGAPEAPVGLGQLAQVFEAISRLDAGGELQRLSKEVLEERRELDRHLARRRDFERQLRESRAGLDEVREERRRAETEAAATKRRIAHLQDELSFVQREIAAAEEDLEMLRESGSGAPAIGGRRGGPAPYGSPEEERHDVVARVRAERELLQRDQHAIEEVRARLDEVFRQKLDCQMTQQTLLEKQRQTEQDRGLMLTAIEAERGKLSAMRSERIRLCEERCGLEREMTEIRQERWLMAHHQGPGPRDINGPMGNVPQNRTGARHPDMRGRDGRDNAGSKGVRHEDAPTVVYDKVEGPDGFEHGGARPPRGDRGVRNGTTSYGSRDAGVRTSGFDSKDGRDRDFGVGGSGVRMGNDTTFGGFGGRDDTIGRDARDSGFGGFTDREGFNREGIDESFAKSAGREFDGGRMGDRGGGFGDGGFGDNLDRSDLGKSRGFGF